jgi:hypothetical protein
MSQARYQAGTSGQYTGTLQTADGTAVVYDAGGSATPRVASLTLTLKDSATGTTINSRSSQNVLNVNNVTVDAAGALKWLIQPGDTTLHTGTRAVEEHLAQFTFTYIDTDGNTKTGLFNHSLVCRHYTPLCSFDDLTSQLGGLDPSEQMYIESLIDAFAERAERETGRTFESATATEYFDIVKGQRAIRVARYPIESVTGIWEDGDGEFDDPTNELIDPTDYDTKAMGDRGIVRMRSRSFWVGEGTVKITYVGGLAKQTHGVGGVPSDIRNAAIRQVAYWYQRRASLGVTGENIGGASVSILAAQDLLEDVGRVLANYTPKTLI